MLFIAGAGVGTTRITAAAVALSVPRSASNAEILMGPVLPKPPVTEQDTTVTEAFDERMEVTGVVKFPTVNRIADVKNGLGRHRIFVSHIITTNCESGLIDFGS
jgi:hypothetical protein